jgi:hypothetical protein
VGTCHQDRRHDRRRTDLWISNSTSAEKDVTVTYYPNTGASSSFTTHMGVFTTIEIDDVVLSRFGFDDSKGLLLLTTNSESGFSARARIYNTGNPAGEFGQFVPGLGLSYLNRAAFIPGVSGINGNRANVGIANPGDQAFPCYIDVWQGDNLLLRDAVVQVPAHSVVQVNDIFTTWDIAPQSNVQVRITSQNPGSPIYTYASIVRESSGDAIFIFGTSPNS